MSWGNENRFKTRSDEVDNNHDLANVHLGDIEIIDMVKVAARANFWLNSNMAKLLFFLCLLTWIFSACAADVKTPRQMSANEDRRLAGRVYQVEEESQFVLIRKYGKWAVLNGETVISQGEGRTANLFPTGEELGEHVAADIRSGSVKVGDAVYIRKSHTN